ncbi:pathogenesis-related thaumatin-like protein 3.5 [Lolium perenne]|uniref:pathogenesis-related thaumatin-like protein 3.5 n=1 Tax=Lolium perenne TaxID=4522 RepID=UPI0021F569F2|nr:pathogenesis-related thaumatin-like protein 3.5 [Lolium perenne]XP_051206391.1 pathogenesis-related thaumatin-like protein 3.5 [Lolium perenne]
MGRRGALLLTLALVCFFSGAMRRADSARVFTIINQCKKDIWPAVTPGESFGGGGFALRPGQSIVFTAPVGWSGRVWGRTGCDFDPAGNGTCETGACGTSLQCASSSGATPASLAEFTLASVDYYDVSLVDGFNLPIVVTPKASANGSSCAVAGCDGDLRQDCPSELAVKGDGGTVVACRSACDVFGTDQYCCRGQYANPVTCQPTFYSKKFKAACPGAYSYAYDDPSSIFTCAQSPDYTIIFCSNRKQSVCSYHNERLVCSGSSGSTSALTLLLLLLLSSFIALQFALPV